MAFYLSNNFDANIREFRRDEYSKYTLFYLMSIFINSRDSSHDQSFQKQE